MDPEKGLKSNLTPHEEGIDIKKYVFLILKNWWWFAITLFISITVSYMINRYSQKVYGSSCSLIIGEPDSRIGNTENILDELARARGRKRKAVVENEISVLKSYNLARMALDELDFSVTYTAIGRRGIAESQLYLDSPFRVIVDSSDSKGPLGTYYITILSDRKYLINVNDEFFQEMEFGEPFKWKSTIFRVELRHPESYVFRINASNKYYFHFNDLNSQAIHYSNALSVEVNAEKGSILSLSMSGFVPNQITDYLNKLCEIYIRSNLEEKNITSINTIEFIDNQLRGVVDSLESTGIRLQKFRSSNQVIDLTKEGVFLFEKAQDLQSQKALLDINSRYYEYLLEYINEKTDFSDIVAPSVVGIEDPLLNSLVAKVNTLNLERRNLSMTVMENSPQLMVANNHIENTRIAIRENLLSHIKTNEIAIRDIENRIGSIENEIQKLPSTERQMINIEREFTINDQVYTFLLEKRAEAGISKASNNSDHKLLDIARPENAVIIKPQRSTNHTLAIALGVIIPFSLIVLIAFFNNKIVDRKDIERNTNVPIIGSIGHSDDSCEIPAFEKPKSSLAESFRSLRANLQFMAKDKEKKVIAITSTVSGEGKTFCSVNLAAMYAMAGKSTLLVSLDLRRPKIHHVFNVKNVAGMSNYLIGKASLNEVLIKTGINNLSLVNAGPIPPNPAELIDSDKMKEFIEQAKEHFDIIVIDTPPVAIVTDALLLKELVDIFVFVIRHGYSSKQIFRLVNDLYGRNYLHQMALLVNDIQLTGYYGYSYNYNYEYGRYGYSSEKYYSDDQKEIQVGGIGRLFGWLFKKLS
jgi:capsular exopolysaccharide synthesis family protein